MEPATFQLVDPFGTAPTQPPFHQSVSTGVPWGGHPVTHEYTIGQLLDRAVARCADNEALIYTDRDFRLTWRELSEVVDNIARGLMALGVKRGEKIALWATNVPHWIPLMFAAAKIGAVLLPLNTSYRTTEIAYALEQSDLENLFVINGFRDTDYLSTIYELIPELRQMPRDRLKTSRFPHLKRIFFLGPEKHRGMYSLDELLALAEETPWPAYQERQAGITCHDVVNMQYTSGTTGFPKGVQLTHHNITNDGFWIGACQNLSPADRVCIPVPLFHCFGCVLGVMACLNHAATMVLLERYDPITVMMSIEREKCTACYGVPTMYIAILDHPLFDKFNYSSLRTGLMSGATCPEVRMRQVVNKMNMTEVSIPYGLTEAGPVMTQTRYFETDIHRKCSTIGQALPGIEVAIIDPESGAIAPIDQAGEICCRGFNTMKGYYKMPELTAACIDANGWLHSGDIGHMDAEGYYYITGRLKDVIIRGGENISPKEVEDFIGHLPGVQDIQLVGVPSKRYGEQPAAFIIRQPDADLVEQDIADFCRNKIAWFKIPKYVHFVDAFPQTASGKIKKYVLREEAARLWPDA